MSLERYLQEIATEDKPLRYGVLTALSHLSREELKRFAGTWKGLSAQRQRQLVARLVELAEDNVDLDYHAICLLCLDSSDPQVREKAIEGLWEYDDCCAVNRLLALLFKDVSPRVRSAAAMGLGKFSMLAEEGKLSRRQAERLKEVLIKALKNDQEHTEVRRRVLEAVAPFGTPVVKEYIRMAYESDDQDLRCSSLYAMGRSGDSSWLSYLVKELTSPSPALRFEAANACGELGDESAVPDLISALEDDSLEVQQAVIRALGEIGGAGAHRALRRCARSHDPAVREAALEVLEGVEAMDDPLTFQHPV